MLCLCTHWLAAEETFSQSTARLYAGADTVRPSAWHGEDPRTLLAFDELVGGITPGTIQAAAGKYFATENTGLFVHLPEAEAGGN